MTDPDQFEKTFLSTLYGSYAPICYSRVSSYDSYVGTVLHHVDMYLARGICRWFMHIARVVFDRLLGGGRRRGREEEERERERKTNMSLDVLPFSTFSRY